MKCAFINCLFKDKQWRHFILYFAAKCSKQSIVFRQLSPNFQNGSRNVFTVLWLARTQAHTHTHTLQFTYLVPHPSPNHSVFTLATPTFSLYSSPFFLSDTNVDNVTINTNCISFLFKQKKAWHFSVYAFDSGVERAFMWNRPVIFFFHFNCMCQVCHCLINNVHHCSMLTLFAIIILAFHFISDTKHHLLSF